MIHITIISGGTAKEKHFREGISEYVMRLSAFAEVGEISVPECRLPDSPSPAEIKAALEKEGEAIVKKIPSGAFIAALCIEGKLMSSEEFSTLFNSAAVRGFSKFCFIIGSSRGLSEEVKSKAQLRLSISPMTFPHTMAKLMLTEQLYRAFSISSGGKYHK